MGEGNLIVVCRQMYEMDRGCQWTFFFPLAAPIGLWVGKRNSVHDFLEMAEWFACNSNVLRQLATLMMSANTPAAVTSAPAP